jgi:ADP-ribose pyrophosphatase YjhB (NUDIX family)
LAARSRVWHYTLCMLRSHIKHCRACGTSVVHRLPDDGDTRVRAICPQCGTVHYENPLNVVGTVPCWGPDGGQVLLCKRNIEPRWGKWTLPAGFMELGESTAEGAVRETHEEAGAQIELLGLYTLLNVVRVGQVHLYYRARLLSDRFDPGHETQEARLFAEHEIPWEELAFRTVQQTLVHYFADRRAGRFLIHTGDID